MDEPMTPMERRVVEYHVWKTQLRQPIQEAFDFTGHNAMHNGSHSEQFLGFKQDMTPARQRDFKERVADAWKKMNALDLGKALNEYENDCPDLPGLDTEIVRTKKGGGR